MGTMVLVKSFPNQPIIRYLIGDSGEYVFICLEHEFKLWEQKGIRPLAVKCPKSRVFYYDPDLYEKLKEAAYILGDNNLVESLWKQALPYEGKRHLNSKVASNVA